MAQVIKDITLEVSKPNVFQALVAKQCDSNSRFLNVTLVNEGKKISIDETSIVAINTCRNNGDSNSFSGEVNEDGTALLPIHAWVLELPGLVKCDVSVMDSEDHKLTSTTFYINVEEAANEEGVIADDIWIERINAETERVAAEESRVAAENQRVLAENERVAAEKQRAEAEESRKVIIDNTLKKEGYAAEAKATGEALAELNAIKPTVVEIYEGDSNAAKMEKFTEILNIAAKGQSVQLWERSSYSYRYMLNIAKISSGTLALIGEYVSDYYSYYLKKSTIIYTCDFTYNGAYTITNITRNVISRYEFIHDNYTDFVEKTDVTNGDANTLKSAKAYSDDNLASAKEYADELFNSIVNGDEVSY